MATYSVNNRKDQFDSVLNSLQQTAQAAWSAFHVAGISKTTSSAPAQVKKYDETYCKESEVSFAGVFMFAIPVMFVVFSLLNFAQYSDYGGYGTFIQILAVGALVFRVIATKWISSIAAEQNRSVTKWRVLSFFLPAISLIIIGQTKKLADTTATARGFSYNGKDSFQQFGKAAASHGLQMAS